jgi:DNA/RNA-binding domain of Phe-tRNA-synthetase-like protein
VIRFDLEHATLQLGIVLASGVKCAPSDELLIEKLLAAEALVRVDASAFPEAVRKAVRDVLRVGGYKPTGRGKPASEYLVGAAREQGLPRVNNLVDINNLVSLMTALPISIFDADQLNDDIAVRFGRSGENYQFNSSGQVMDLSGIPVVCRAATDEPVGNAVKDSMLAKVGPTTRNVTAVLYGSRQLTAGYLAQATQQMAQLLTQSASATDCRCLVLPE